jgi:hypothetical protein
MADQQEQGSVPGKQRQLAAAALVYFWASQFQTNLGIQVLVSNRKLDVLGCISSAIFCAQQVVAKTQDDVLGKLEQPALIVQFWLEYQTRVAKAFQQLPGLEKLLFGFYLAEEKPSTRCW